MSLHPYKVPSLPLGRATSTGHKAPLGEGALDFFPCPPVRSSPLCSAQPVHLFEAALGIQVLNQAWGSQGQKRRDAPLGGPGGQENCPFPASKGHSACFQMPFSSEASAPPAALQPHPLSLGFSREELSTPTFPGFWPGPSEGGVSGLGRTVHHEGKDGLLSNLLRLGRKTFRGFPIRR